MNAVATTRANKYHCQRVLALVWLEMCHDPRVRESVPSGHSGRFYGAGVRHTEGLSEKLLSRSSSSIHMLYAHTPSGVVAMRMAPPARWIITLCTEVVVNIVRDALPKYRISSSDC